jgi:multiple sugar transport system substrate-binding protein
MNKELSRREFLVKGARMAGGLAMLSSMGGIISACVSATTSGSGKVTELKFQTWTVEAKEVIAAQVDMFKKAYPNINVTVEILAYDDYWKKLPISMSGGGGPDLYMMTRPSFETYAKANQAAIISKEVAASKKLLENFSHMNDVFVKAYQYKGETRGVPLGVDCTAIVYNKTLIAKEGLKMPAEIEKEWTWKELREYAVKLTKRSGTETSQYGLHIPVNRMPLFEYIWSNGGEIFNAAGDKCMMAGKEGMEAVQFLADMMLNDKVSAVPAFTKSQSADDLFLTGKIAMMHAGSWTIGNYAKIKDFEWDVAEIPMSPTTRKRVTSSNVLGYVVGPNAKAKGELIQLMEQLTSKESQLVYAEKKVFIPAYKEAQDPYFQTAVPANMKAFQRALAYSHPMILTEWVPYAQVIQIINGGLEQIFGGKVAADKGWKAAEDEMNKIIAENKAKG